ncbi:MAG: phosphatidate cytidylyltransferase [Rhodovarius sp.]|nr:phosphatidate cytidylyltransferase [Rhodovarius sp.]MDW8314471.1 phosphatidate cytidylyltransferase [Rhodovarius sp.]
MGGAAPPGRWRDLRLRLATTAVLLPAAVLCIWWGGWWFAGLLLLCLAGLGWEWARLCGAGPVSAPGLLLPAAAVGAGALASLGFIGAALLLLPPAAALAWRSGRALPRGFLAAGVLYLGLAGVALAALRADPEAGQANVLFLFAVVWASDSAAYLTGRRVGGPRLWPAISPGKTWSGAAGGLLGAAAVGAVAAVLSPGIGWMQAVLVAALLGVVSQAGDLLESGLKRRFGAKDSSALIPGHGGLLDRLDGVLAAAPVAAVLAWWAGQGELLWR